MDNAMILDDAEYGLADAAIRAGRWLSAATLPDVLARPAVLTAGADRQTPALRRFVIKRRGSESIVEVHAHHPTSPTFLKSVEAIVDLLSLPPGWNSYAAKPIAPRNVVRAIRLLGELLEPKTPAPIVVPRAQGGIQLEWHTESIDIEVYVDSPEKVSFFAEQNETGEEVEDSFATAAPVLKAWLRRLCEK